MRKDNQAKYGLTEQEVKDIKLPPITNCQIYSIDKIVKSKGKLSTIEKIVHLQNLEEALLKKLDQLKEQKKL